MQMQIVDAERVHALLDYPGLIEAFRQAHKGGMPKHGGRFIFSEPNADAQADALILLPAWQPGEGILVKMVTSFPLNRKRHDTATVQSLYVYLNGATGVPEAAVDGEALIFRKTSADSALGASILAREDAEEFLMIGAGGLAPYLVRAHLTVRPGIRRVTIWNRTAANAAKLAAALSKDGIPAETTDDLDAAVARADIITSATMATEPHLKGRLLRRRADPREGLRRSPADDRAVGRVPRTFRPGGDRAVRRAGRSVRAGPGPRSRPHLGRRHHAHEERGRRASRLLRDQVPDGSPP